MLGRYAKVGVFALALVVLAVEGYLLYEYYDRYYGRSTVSDTVAGNVAASGEATRRYASGSDSNPGSGTSEGTAASTTSAAENAGSVEPGFKASFAHRASDENSRGDYTYLSDPSIDGDPNALVLVTPSPDRANAGGSAYDHNIGVWYEFADQKKWAIFNQDRAAVPAGAAFEVALPQASEGFVHRAEPTNTVGNSTYLDDPLTNGKPDAVVSVTQNWNPGGGGGVYNDHPVGVMYDEDVEKWAVYNEDDAPMPDGVAFNVAVPEDARPAR
jgi:hypothetical protein